jgi:hypothetical protein
MNKKYSTTFLLPKKNFIIGMASAFSLFGGFYDYNASPSPQEADLKAIMNDIGVVAQDLIGAANEQK